jgi:hypothetical protein
VRHFNHHGHVLEWHRPMNISSSMQVAANSSRAVEALLRIMRLQVVPHPQHHRQKGRFEVVEVPLAAAEQ